MATVEWVTSHRGTSAGLLDSAVTDPAFRGAFVVGPAGVGKTVLAHDAAERYSRRHPKAISYWISATASATRVPFGAFSHLVEVTGADEPAALLREARLALCRPGAKDILVAVDDAHLLDTLSATLVHQLVTTASARLILTARADEPVPDAITTLWKDALVSRVDIQPFTRAETTQLVEKVLGGPLETASANRIFTLSQGNPLYLRHLVEAAAQAGSLRNVDGVWQLRGEMTMTPQLSELIQRHLTSLPDRVLGVLEYLAVEEPITVSDLSALIGRAAVEEAESVGAVTIASRGYDLVAHPAHPLYTEGIRGSMGRLTARRLRTKLVERLSTREIGHISDRLQLAALAIDSDNPPDVPDILAASWEAMQLGDLGLGERLARGALERSQELPARLALAHSLSWQGRGRETDEALAPVNPDELTEWELTAWTLPKAANQFWMLRESEQAVAFLQDMRTRIAEPAALNTIDALAATFAMNAGEPRRAVEVASEVLAAPTADDLAVAWAASAAALSSARLGRLADVDPLAERCLAAEHPGLVRYAGGLAQVLSTLLAGNVSAAEDLAHRYLDFAEFQQPGRAIGEVIFAQVLLAKGDLEGAERTLRQATAALKDTGYSWGPMGLMHLARALGQRGEADAAADVLRRAEAGHGMRSELYAPELALARAWTLAAARDIPGAVSAAREAVRVALRSGQRAVALQALHDGVRLGDAQAAERAGPLVAELDCALGAIVLRHARALAGHDGAGLADVSVELGAVGMNSAAADAAAQAAAAFEAGGDRKRQLAARARAADLAERCGRPSTPALERVLSPLPLTGREREVAVMVAAGLPNKAIAERLGISVRTVEGHIYHACTKLDVPDRTSLAHAVAAATAGSGSKSRAGAPITDRR